jgi:hypothetical protein
MSSDFDPYHKWLGIGPAEQPPSHYRLLGIPEFESDPQVIDAAADRQLTFLRKQQLGPHQREANWSSRPRKSHMMRHWQTSQKVESRTATMPT